MNPEVQDRKARTFLALHHDPKLLILPNIWDPLGALLLESQRFPAAATASAAVAWSMGIADGEKLPFVTALEVIGRIAACVKIPITADIERGYAETPEGVAGTVRRVLRAGAVGINLEDSIVEGGPLRSVQEQCDRLRAARQAADEAGISLVINARIDCFLREDGGTGEEKIAETISRGKAYMEAGADCLYPILAADRDLLVAIRSGTGAPINVYASASLPPVAELEEIGISRLSLGPGFLKAGLTTMRNAARHLLETGSYEPFTREVISSDEIGKMIEKSETERGKRE